MAKSGLHVVAVNIDNGRISSKRGVKLNIKMANDASVSVIVPTFNRAHTIVRALKSVVTQSCPVLEIIVVDDGSSDDTRKHVQSLNHPAIVYHYQDNHGVSHARNTGIHMARGNWIAFLDSDDEWMPNKVALQLDAIRGQPDYRLCHSDEIWIRDGKRVNQMVKHQKYGGDIFEKCLPLCVISPSSVMIRRDTVSEIGLFDEALPACEDYDYWLRFCARYPVLYLDSCLIKKYGGHSDQLSRKYWGMDRFRVLALGKILSDNLLNENRRQLVIDMIETKCAILEKGARKHGNHQVLDFCNTVRQDMLAPGMAG